MMTSVLTGSVVKDLTCRLQEAIYSGNEKVAKDLVAELSSCHLNLNIYVSEERDSQQSPEKEFSVTVQVEDRETSGSYFSLFVRSTDTVADLKRKVWFEHKFPYEVQRWIIGKRIPDDKVSLWRCGVVGPGYTLYLYIVTARSVGLSQQDMRSEKFENVTVCYSDSLKSNTMSYGEQGKGVGMLLMNPNFLEEDIPSSQSHSLPPPIPPRKPMQEYDDPDETKVVQLPPAALMSYVLPPPVMEKKPQRSGWTCSFCTYFNLPTRPGCEMCASNRPDDYEVPADYRMTDDELALLAHQEEVERMTRQPLPEQTTQGMSSGPVSSRLNVNPYDPVFEKFQEGNLSGSKNCSAGQSKGHGQTYPFLREISSDED